MIQFYKKSFGCGWFMSESFLHGVREFLKLLFKAQEAVGAYVFIVLKQ